MAHRVVTPVFLLAWWGFLWFSWLAILAVWPHEGSPFQIYTNWALGLHAIGITVMLFVRELPPAWWWFLHGTAWIVFTLSSFMLLLNPSVVADVDNHTVGIRFLLERVDHVLPLLITLLLALKYQVYPRAFTVTRYLQLTYGPMLPLTIYVIIFDPREIYGIRSISRGSLWLLAVIICSLVNGILLYEHQLESIHP